MTADSTADRLASIRARADAATAGPWLIDAIETGEHALFIDSDRDPAEAGLGTGGYMVASWLTESNAEFIAAARTEVPFLLDQLAAAEAIIAQALDYVENHEDVAGWWVEKILSASPVSALDAVRADAWDECLTTIEEYELNTDQARKGNPYRAAQTGATDAHQ